MQTRSEITSPDGDYRWYLSPDLTPRIALFFGGPVIVFFLLLHLLGPGDLLQAHLAEPLEFQARHWMNRDPKLDPRLRIYVLDDATVGFLGDDDLTLDQWGRLLSAFAPYHPRCALVAKQFGTPRGREHAGEFVQAMRKLPFALITGGFTVPASIRGRTALQLDEDEYDLLKWIPRGETLASLRWMPILPGNLYGPHELVRDAFHVGHSHYDGDGLARGFLRLSEGRAVPNMNFLVAANRSFEGGRLYLDRHPVPLDHSGRTMVNFAHPSTYSSEMHDLYHTLRWIKEGKGPTKLAPDSVVLVLPDYFTGHTDLVRTPFGMLPGGLVSVALVNSVLTGQWISELPAGFLLLVATGLAGIALASLLEGLAFWSGLAGGSLAIGAGGILLFAFASVDCPWLPAVLGFFLSGLAVFAKKAQVAGSKRERLRLTLEGSLPPATLAGFLNRPSALSLDPTGRVVTIMFVDIVGFSIAAERQTPKQAFLHLKRTLSLLTEIVYQFGGIVDKTMGDGMLCYFGYQLDGSETTLDHADQALRCALRLQRENIKLCLDRSGDRPIYPLRIGINTAAVYMGDLGSANKIDLTLIGHGVNMAKRLEAACGTFDILIGATTKDMLLQLEATGCRLEKRMIQIKHHEALIDAYECDPFREQPELRARAMEAYWAFARVDRVDARFPLPPGVSIKVITPLGNGQLVNFSESGLGVCLRQYLGREVVVNLTLDSIPEGLRERLAAKGLLPIAGEVRWGRPAENGYYVMGLSIRNFTAEQRAVLQAELRAAIVHALPDRRQAHG